MVQSHFNKLLGHFPEKNRRSKLWIAALVMLRLSHSQLSYFDKVLLKFIIYILITFT